MFKVNEVFLKRHKRYIIKGLLLFIVTLMAIKFIIKSAFASSSDEEVFAAFEWFCLSHLQKPETIEQLFPPLGIQPLPQDQADAFLSPQKGKAWIIPGSITKGFVVTLTDSGVCTINGSYANGKETQNIFEKNTKNIKLTSETVGSQTQDVYALVFSGANGVNMATKALVSITTSNLKSIDGIILTAMPEKLMLENNIHINNWPE